VLMSIARGGKLGAWPWLSTLRHAGIAGHGSFD
jgi:hypothetical protein